MRKTIVWVLTLVVTSCWTQGPVSDSASYGACIMRDGYNVSHPSFPPLLHGATGWELKKEQRFVKSMLKSLFLLTRP